MTSHDELGTSLRRALSRPLLSRAEEVRLAIAIERGDEAAKQRMIESNLRLVLSLARTYGGSGVPLADLFQEGTIGLIRAVERFDHRRGLKFSTYAVWWIRGALREAVAGANVIRIPPRAHRQLAAVARATASLDAPVGDDDTPLIELLADESAADPSESAVADEETRMVRGMLRLLPARHRDVVIRRYGLNHRPPESHQQIRSSLGVGEERSRQLELEALHRLRTIATAQAA